MIDVGEIVLRPLEPHDVEPLYKYRNDVDITRRLGGFSAGYSRADLSDWLEAHRRKGDEVLWAIAVRDDDLCIGHVGLYQIDHRIGKAEFAILIGSRAHQGKGIGKKVTRAVLDYGFGELRLHKISLSVLADNEPAIRLYEGLGFFKEGVLRDDQFRDGKFIDLILMSILNEEWKSTVTERR